MIGSRILAEALHRGHTVTACVRDVSKLAPAPGLTAMSVDIFDPEAIAAAIPGHDIVISAFGPGPENPRPVVDAAVSLTTVLTRFPEVRLIVVGGSGTLEVAPGVRFVDTPEFVDDWKPIAFAHANAWDVIRNSAANWTYASPSGYIHPGTRTGVFRIGTNQLLRTADGNSEITTEDFAVAILDEVAEPKYVRARFTAGY